MSEGFVPVEDADALRAIEQYYYREARMLDERRYLSWLALLSPDIRYVLPAPFIPLAHAARDDPGSIHAIGKELSGDGADALPLREESYVHLARRADRAMHPVASAESPVPRTRRFVTNVEIGLADGSGIRALSNLLLFHSRHGRPDHIFSGQRRDRLERHEGSFRIVEREVILDGDGVTGASVALFF